MKRKLLPWWSVLFVSTSDRDEELVVAPAGHALGDHACVEDGSLATYEMSVPPSIYKYIYSFSNYYIIQISNYVPGSY